MVNDDTRPLPPPPPPPNESSPNDVQSKSTANETVNESNPTTSTSLTTGISSENENSASSSSTTTTNTAATTSEENAKEDLSPLLETIKSRLDTVDTYENQVHVQSDELRLLPRKLLILYAGETGKTLVCTGNRFGPRSTHFQPFRF